MVGAKIQIPISMCRFLKPLALGHKLQKYCFSCTLWAVRGLHGIVVKCAAAIVFPTEDWKVQGVGGEGSGNQ